jgi:transglutaminase-like putative cysteine protease
MERHCKIAIAVLAMAIFTHPFRIGLGVAQPQQNAPTQTAQTANAPYAQQYESHFTIHADHSATEVFTHRFKILTQSAIQSVSQQKLLFVEGMQTLNTVEAFTEKPDGRRLPIDPKNILTQDASPGLPMTYFRDLKQRTIIFPGVGVDDTLVMTHKKEIQKRAKQFTAHEVFPRSSAFTSIKITVEAPVAIDLRVKATGKGVVESVADTGGVRRHTIAITPDSYTPEETGAVSPLDRDPAILISTYKSYGELGSAYGKTALPRAAVTPNIAALAKEITKNISDRKAQAIAIDAWMKRNIRYVAIFLSVGRIIPNDAATVLKNKFGDCKDKTTLMSALLAAKGIASEPVLINLGNAYTLPEPPTFAALNHVILHLPDFDLYDDPTANWAAFGVLPFESYDKPVVRVSTGGATLAHTPAMKPDDHTAYARTTINVAADGTVTGRTEESNTGALGIALRFAGAAVQTLGDEMAARRQLQSFNTPGTGNFELGNITETMDPVTIKSSFALNERFRPPPAGARAAIPPGMALTVRPGNFLLGSRLNGRKAAFVCYAGRQTEDIEATFDQALPMPVPFVPVTIDNATFSYRSTMNAEGRTLKLHREFVAHVERQVCPPELEPQIVADLNAVRVNVNSTYAFNNPAQPATRYPPKPPQTIELTRVASVGQKLRLEFLYSIQPDCSSVGLATVRILEAPQHGKLTVENGQGFTNFPKENQRYECNTRKSDGVIVYYEPDAGFTGRDSVTVDVIFASGTSSKRHYSIEVK